MSSNLPNIIWQLVGVIGFIFLVVILFAVVFPIMDSTAINNAMLILGKLVNDIEGAKTSQREITFDLPDIVESIEIVPADSGKGKSCLLQTCTRECLESPYYIYVTFTGKNSPRCVEKSLCCSVQFTDKTLLGTSTSNKIGGKISYTLQVNYNKESNTFNSVVINSKSRSWGELAVKNVRSLLG